MLALRACLPWAWRHRTTGWLSPQCLHLCAYRVQLPALHNSPRLKAKQGLVDGCRALPLFGKGAPFELAHLRLDCEACNHSSQFMKTPANSAKNERPHHMHANPPLDHKDSGWPACTLTSSWLRVGYLAASNRLTCTDEMPLSIALAIS